ncbi:MAG: hypothetical protein LUF29_00245 [Oscillospiraceae bacterium]|nr:hypothetical protein [Oscillospiraceae bacterium]
MKTGLVYLGCSLFLALFGAVYEIFSHEVYSYYMIYAFAIPLAGGALPSFLFAYFGKHIPNRASHNLYNSGIAALSIGSVFTGVLKIYGTTNRLTAVYWVVGFGLIIISVCLYLSSIIKTLKKSDEA